MISTALMEKSPAAKCTSSGLQVPAMPTTVKDVPVDCMELIMERLALVDHYKGWWSLIQPYSLRASPFSRDWLLIESKVGCGFCATRGFEDGSMESPDLPGKHDFYFSLLFYDPGQGKEQAIVVNLESLITTRDCEYRNISRPVLETDKGLILVNVYQHVRSIDENRHDRFLVLNPINNTKSFLPPIPSRLCRCKLFRCDCKAIPLKLTVNMEEKGVLKGPLYSSYKAYILERKDLPKCFRRYSQPESLKYNFRVTVYDSMTQFWARTGAEWIGTSLHTQIFPMGAATFYVSAGGDTPCYNSIHHILYKFQDGILVGKVKAPAKVKANHNCDFDVCLLSWDSCGCISATVFESKGKIFFFQQKSWVGLFGPNCISAIVWELNDREMVWVKLHVLHPQKFQFCSRLQNEMNIMLRYEGILLVFRGQKYTSYEHPTSEFCCVAGFDTFKKTWCKVPEGLLENLSRPFQQGYSMTESMKLGQKFHFYGESLIFEPRVTTRA